MAQVTTIQGGVAKDLRGQIRFVNDFDMSLVKRFYMIKNADITLIRGWRAHRIEQRWFYCINGAFRVDIVKIDNWDAPATDLPLQSFKIYASGMQVLYVPTGYGTAFRALEPDSELLVFADHEISHAPLDDYTWPSDYFENFVL